MHRTLVILGFMLATTAGFSQSAKKPLSDAALDKVTAAGVSATVTNGVVKFQGEVPTPNGLVTSTGTLAVQTAPAGSTNLSSLTLSGNAQQNLNSLINITAVNSKINVLLNLNVNINSTVGQISQSNLNGKP